jgi:hypothetical protein
MAIERGEEEKGKQEIVKERTGVTAVYTRVYF